jgi:hypothetical protein
MTDVLTVITALAGLASGLVAAYVTLSLRAAISQVRFEMAEMENRIVEKINGKYLRTDVFMAYMQKLERDK